MKFTLYSNYNFGRLIIAESFEIECEGSGTESDPLIIDPSEKIPKNFFLRDSRIYVIIRNFKTNNISLQSCSNITFDKCQLKRCWIVDSFSININNSSVEYLKFVKSSKIVIENSSFERIKLIKSFKEILFKKSNIDRVKEDHLLYLCLENTVVQNPYIFKPFKFMLKDNKRLILYLIFLILIVLIGILLVFIDLALMILYMIILFFLQLFLSVINRRKVTRNKRS